MNQSKASLLPVIVGGSALVASSAIALLVLSKWQFAFKELSFVGWALTPLIVFLSLALDFYLQRKGRANPNFIIKPAYTQALTIFSYVALVIAGFHIWVIADMLSAS